jgi:hypothetical protein
MLLGLNHAGADKLRASLRQGGATAPCCPESWGHPEKPPRSELDRLALRPDRGGWWGRKGRRCGSGASGRCSCGAGHDGGCGESQRIRRAESLGRIGTETPQQMDVDTSLIESLETIGCAAAVATGLAPDTAVRPDPARRVASAAFTPPSAGRRGSFLKERSSSTGWRGPVHKRVRGASAANGCIWGERHRKGLSPVRVVSIMRCAEGAGSVNFS